MFISELLKEKGTDIWSVDVQAELKDTLRLMDEKNIGAVLVKDENKIAGGWSVSGILSIKLSSPRNIRSNSWRSISRGNSIDFNKTRGLC